MTQSTSWFVGSTVSAIERELILQTLDHYRGNRTQAARVLGISIRTLRNKISQYTAQGFEVSRSSHGADSRLAEQSTRELNQSETGAVLQ